MIRKQLCPWAGRSAALQRLRYVDATASTPLEAAFWVEKEAKRLAEGGELSSTVVVFGQLELFESFDVFDAYVRAPRPVKSLKELRSKLLKWMQVGFYRALKAL